MPITQKNLRYLGGRRIGGIIIAFTGPDRRDAYNNYWTPDSNLANQRYDQRPLYYQHRGDVEEAGYILSSDLRVSADGLYMECDLLPNTAGDAVLHLVQNQQGFFSTGVMPGSWREAADGWVELWPWVECSVTHKPATKFGLTRASIVRSSLGLDVAGDGDEELRRGPVGLQELTVGQNTPQAAPAAAPSPAAQVDMAALTAAVNQILETQASTRSLSPAALPAALRPQPAAPKIEVGHRFDDLTIAALGLWGTLRLSAGKFTGEQETEWIRALREKVEKQRKRDEAIPDDMIMRGAVRMIDSQVVTDWGKHIRADEAMTSTYVGYGDELVPTLLSSVLWYHFMVEAKVLPALQRIQLPSEGWKYPIITGGPVIRKVPQLEDQANFIISASVFPASKISTSTVDFATGEIGALVLAEQHLFEDAGYAIANMWATQMLRKISSAIDEVIISGDEHATTGNISHFGTDPTATVYDKVLIVDGLRHMAVTDAATVAQTTIDQDSTVGLRAKMGARGKFGLKPSALINIVDPGVYFKLLALDAIESVADIGPQATLLTGQVGQIKGVPVIVADELESTNASGQIENSHDSTKGSHLVVNRENVVVGYRREITTELAKIPGVGGYFADISVRFDVQEMEAGQVAEGYNATV